jgi:hypothetical protein
MRDERGLDTMQWFRAYGLLFASSIDIPEMVPARDRPRVQPDVIVAREHFPDSLREPLATSDVHEVNRDALLLRVAGVGRYLVTNGRAILFDPDPAATAHDVRVYLLGTCLGALLHQRGFYVLHASGIAAETGAVLFTGDSGAGKSTLLSELLDRGYPMVVDDVCAIRFEDHTPIVVPSYPRTRLWADAASRLAIDTTDLPRTRSSWDKFERQVGEQFSDAEVALSHVFHLARARADDPLAVQRLSPIDAFTTLVENTYRSVLLDGMNIRGSHFELATELARSVDVIRVRRPLDMDTVVQVADLIVQTIEAR